MKKLYYEDKYLKENTTKIVKTFEENGKYYVMLEESIFYPQGGGQKGDRGYLTIDDQRYEVLTTVKDEEFNSVNILDRPVEEKYLDSEVKAYLNFEFRYKQMRLHSALHSYHMVLEKVMGETLEYPISSNIEDGFAYNRYNETAFDPALFIEATKQFLELIKTDEVETTYKDPEADNPNFRIWECMNYRIPCGGIHVDKLSDIGEVTIETSHKKKVNTVKIFVK